MGRKSSVVEGGGNGGEGGLNWRGVCIGVEGGGVYWWGERRTVLEEVCTGEDVCTDGEVEGM